MRERIRQLAIKEFIQVFRDRRMRAIVFATPIMQLMLFGYAVTSDVRQISTAFYDLDRSGASRELGRRLESSGYFTIAAHPESTAELRDLVDRGAVGCAVQVNEGFSSSLKRREPAEVQIIVDGTDSNTATVAMDYASRIIKRYGEEAGGIVPVKQQGLVVYARAWYNPDLRSRNYNVPGVIAIVIMLVCLLLTSMAVVREREVGTMEQLMVTPLRPLEMMLGKTIPFAVIGFLDVLLVTLVAIFWFDIPVKGQLRIMPLATGIYLLSVLGIGLFISTISKTQQQALMATFMFYIPAVLLSGFMFPIDNMPKVIQYGTYLNPLRYLLVIIRGIFLKGSGLGQLWPQMLPLLALGLAVLTVSSFRFRKRLE